MDTGTRSWSSRLTELAARHRLPGATLGILRTGARIETAGYGTLNLATGVSTTPDSVFQIGSISKVFTATMTMQLVDDGVLDLDRPVAQLLPELRPAGDPARQAVTVRHLLTHSSGIDGDLFADTGRGDDALERLVALLGDQPQTFPPGSAFSYCNVGFLLVGRVIEVLTGTTWDRALRDRVIVPLGLDRTSSLPEEAILHRVAVGHLADQDGTPTPTRTWMFPRCSGPAGLVNSSVHDLLTFAGMHLRDGRGADGTPVLSPGSAREMRRSQFPVPDGLAPHHSRGLGWNVHSWGGRTVLGHAGAVIGQYAFLSVVPDAGFAVALLTNGPGAAPVWDALHSEILAEEVGIDVPQPAGPLPPAGAVDLARHVGRYSRTDHAADVVVHDGGLRVRFTDDWHTEDGPSSSEFDLHPSAGGSFVFRQDDAQPWSRLLFGRLPDGREYVYTANRLTLKRG